MKPIQTRTINIPMHIGLEIKTDLSSHANIEEICEKYKSFETMTWTANFPNGVDMDIKFCCGDIHDTDSNPLWTEAVLFDNGFEIAHTDVEDDLHLQWELESDQFVYRVNIQFTKEKKPHINVFFDMDNTLSILQPETETIESKKRIHTVCHYFRNLKPNPQIKKLTEYLATTPYAELFLISHTTEQSQEAATENMYDKTIWRDENYPVFDNKHTIWIPNQTVTKAKAVELIYNRKLTRTDILIDDYNLNLKAWNAAGGTAIKLINNDNSISSYSGPIITPNMDTTTIIKMLLNLIYGKPKNKLIVLRYEDGCIADIFKVKNWDHNFANTLSHAITNWQNSDREFTEFVYEQLLPYYDIETIDHEEYELQL